LTGRVLKPAEHQLYFIACFLSVETVKYQTLSETGG
jgi:hypothetical protein